MVGLYKDPNGDKITFPSSAGNHSIGTETNDQVKQLQRRVSELESSLRKYVSVSSVKIKLYRDRTANNGNKCRVIQCSHNGPSHERTTSL